MYRPKYHHITKICALAALAMTGCAQGDEPDPVNPPSDPEDKVMFGAYVWSRASVADIDYLKRKGFGVFAYQTGSDDFNSDTADGYKPDFMYNQEVTWKVSSSGEIWSYEPAKDWPASKLSFFAYAPYTSTFGPTGITGLSDRNASGSPRLTFTPDSDVDKQIDLLFADAEQNVNLVKAGHVQFRMRHALSRIGFKRAADETIYNNTTVTINSIVFKSAALGTTADLNLYTGAWENIRTSQMEYAFTTADFNPWSNVITNADGTSTANMTPDDKYLMIIPSNEPVPVEITVNYDVETIDTNLTAGSIKINNEITTSFDFNFKTGEAYSFTLRLGLKSVKIGADITDWENSDSGWTPEEGK